MCTTERENPQRQDKKHFAEETKMNEKTAQQIARMKEQTIGVEVEMNHITRELLRNKQIRKHSRQKRILHLVSMGFTGQRMEIPERRKHCRMRCRKMRTGYTNP